MSAAHIDPNISNCTYTGSNCISPEWKQKESLVKFVIEYGFITLQSGRCSKILTTIPATWSARGIKAEDAIARLNILTDLEKIFHSIVVSKDDEELIDFIGMETYGFIKFLLHMNKAIYIEKCKLIFQDYSSPATSTLAQGTSRYKQFKMTYTPDIESRFSSSDESKKTVLRFHGTPAENIMPILATGLRNCSKNDDLRLNGAVHGDGIYLSDSAEFSLSYCRSDYAGSGGAGSSMAMLVYEVLDDPKWFKTHNIYVVDDESALILRYIIVISDYNYSKDSHVFTKLTSVMRCDTLKDAEAKKEKAKMAVMHKAYNKRLMIEFRQLMKKSVAELGFSVKLAEEGNLRVWMICIPSTGLNNPTLEAQMQKLAIPFLELEISFPEGYPIEPPFPRVIYPRFQSLTGHITAGGSICMEAISKSGWVPTTNMESLITQIKLVLAEGDAMIDETNACQRYEMAEAKQAFQRAMATHKWC
jgi:ubiquitin-conjugating enzyme E2 Q